jgi:PAS domain S-box-containing protein
VRTSRKIAASFLIAALVLVVGGVATWAILRYREHERWVAHTLLVRARIDHLRANVEAAETSERGYLLTADTAYLSAYRAARAASLEELARLRRLTADNSRQRARLDSIAPRLEERMDELAETIAERERAGLRGAVAAIGARDVRAANELRGRLQTLHREEDRLLGERTAAGAAAARTAVAVVVVGSVLVFLLLAASVRWLQLDARERERTLAQMRAMERITDATISALALDEILDELLRRLREELRVDAATVLLRARDGAHLEVCAVSGSPELEAEARARARIPLGEGIAGRIAADGRGRIVDDVRAAQPASHALQRTASSLMGVPLLADGAVIGVLHVTTTRPRRFTADELTLLELVADRAAIAIERARAYHAQRRSEERFRLLVEGVEDHALFLLDREGRVASWNAGAERLGGWPPSDAVGARFALFFPPEEAASRLPERLLQDALEHGHESSEGWRVRRDGSRFWAETSLTALRDDDGAPLGWAVITRDLSERRAAEAEREHLLDRERELRREAEHASAAKSHFLATMSHELRTPLNAVLGYAELLGLGIAGPVTSGQRGYLDRIAVSGRHLLGLIDDVLDFSRVEAGRIAVAAAPARMSAIAHAAVSLVRPQAAARQLELEVRCDGGEPYFLGDEHRVRQILVNLLSNAVKFTEGGGTITVTCGIEQTSGGNGGGARVFAAVRDTGVGIPPEKLETIFEPFVQLEQTHTRTAGGVGLGLAISRRFAEAMGGTLEATSVPGEGSTFTLRLPIAPPQVRRLDPVRRAAVGQMIIASAGEIAAATADAMRGDSRLPRARQLSDPELEDHVAALLADIGQTFSILDEDRDAEAQAALIADGTTIRGTISELHGAQRRRHGWSEADMEREFEILRAEVTRTVRRGLAVAPEAPLDESIQLVELLLDDYHHLSLAALNTEGGAPGVPPPVAPPA